jgi:aspartate racemase
MKTVGLIGGVSWVSTAEYYSRLNIRVNQLYEGVSSARVVMQSFNFDDILPCQMSGDSQLECDLLIDAATKVEDAGAELLLICSSTTNMLVDAIQGRVGIPVISMADALSDFCISNNLFRVGLLGTRRVMYGGFMREALEKNGIESVVPPRELGDEVNRIIYEELILNNFNNKSKQKILACIQALKLRTVEAVILGCTELPLLVTNQDDNSVAIIDCIDAHIDQALKHMRSIQ